MDRTSSSSVENSYSFNFSKEEYFQLVREYSDNDHWFDSTTEVAIILSYSFVVVVGFALNSLICLAMIMTPKLRTRKNLFILNLAISDILMCIVCLPFTVVKLVLKNWPFGEVLCKIVPTIQMIDVFVGTATVTAIAVDRYKAIVFAKLHSSNKTQVQLILIVIWVVATVMSLPILIFQTVMVAVVLDNQAEYTICMEVWSNYVFRAVYTTLIMTSQYILPMLVVITLHARICNKLRERIQENAVTDTELRRALREIKRHRKNTLLLTTIVMTFVITWLPLTVLNMAADFDYRIFLNKNFHLTYAIALLLAMTSACVNPVIYGWFNTNFRNTFLNILGCKFSNNEKHFKDDTQAG